MSGRTSSSKPSHAGDGWSRSPQSSSPAKGVDTTALMRIRNLQLRARIVVEGFLQGLHRSPLHGFSAEFSEYRPYSLGEDLRYVDWRVVARTDRYFVKRFDDETNRRAYVALDLSRSMEYGSVGYTKADYARTVAATFAFFLNQQRDAVGLMTFDEQLRDFLPARYRPGHFRQFLIRLERATAGTSTGFGQALQTAAGTLRKRGLILLISDFLVPLEPLQKPLAYLRSWGHELYALRILDPTECLFDGNEPLQLRDLETGRLIFVDPQQARADYQSRFESHAAQWRDLCKATGIDHAEMTIDQPIDRALSHWVAQQSLRRGSVASRRTSASRARSVAP